jgi:hypothetical protein
MHTSIIALRHAFDPRGAVFFSKVVERRSLTGYCEM